VHQLTHLSLVLYILTTCRTLGSLVGNTVATATAITERKSELDLQRRADVRRWEGFLGSPPTTPVNVYATATDREDFASPTPSEQISAIRVKVTPSETHEASVLEIPLVGAKQEFVFEATARLQPRREDQYGTTFESPRTDDTIHAYGGENFGPDGQLDRTRGPPLQGGDDSFEPIPLGALAEGAMTLTEDEIQFILDAFLQDEKPIVLLGQGRNLYDTPGNRAYREEVRARRQEQKDNSDKRVVPLDIIKQFRFAIKVSGEVQYLYITAENELVDKVQGDLRTRKRCKRSP
jgi:hypothetical protein